MKNFIINNKKIIGVGCICIILFVIGIVINQKEEEVYKNEISEFETQIKVTIIGEVKYPNSYYVSKNTKVRELIELACGLTSDGDTSLLNLNQILKEGDVIYVRSKLKDSKDKININTASVKDLQKLEGITETKACNIILYRINNGPFNNILDLLEVNGIDAKILTNIVDEICLS